VKTNFGIILTLIFSMSKLTANVFEDLNH